MRPFQEVGESPIDEKMTEAANSANDFVKYYKSNEILFNETTCKIFDKINESFLKAWKDFRRSRQFGTTASPELSQDLIEKELDAYYKTLLEDIPKLKNELKQDFRKILGVEHE